MKHARPDYNRIQDPLGKIPDDEPVFLLRAQDLIAAGIVQEYAFRAKNLGYDKIAEAAYEHADRMEEWLLANVGKLPDM